MIKKISIQNFKGISDPVTIDLAPVTLLFGANSAGKSTVLHAIQYMGDILSERYLAGVANCKHTASEKFPSLVNGRDLNKTMKIAVEFELPPCNVFEIEELDEPIFTPQTIQLTLHIRWNSRHSRAYVSHFYVSADGEPVAWINAEPGRRGQLLQISLSHPAYMASIDSEWGVSAMTKFWDLIEGQCEDVSSVFSLPNTNLENGIADLVRNLAVFGVFSKGMFTHVPAAEFGKVSDSGAGAVWLALPVETGCDAVPAFGREWLRNWEDVDLSTIEIYADGPENPPISQNRYDYETYLGVAKRARSIFRFFVNGIFTGLTGQALNIVNDAKSIGPLRSVPGSDFFSPNSQTQVSWQNGLSAWKSLLNGSGLIDEVNTWLFHKLKTNYQLNLHCVIDIPEQEYVRLMRERQPLSLSEAMADTGRTRQTKTLTLSRLYDDRSPEFGMLQVDLENVGVGISQIIPVLVAACDHAHCLVSIEQPELHIHPRMQTELGDLFIQGVQRCGNQFLIETHSEHLILRLLRRIRESVDSLINNDHIASKFQPEDLAIYYMEGSAAGTSVKRIRLDSDGDFIDRWPRGFFNERLGEL